MESIPMDSSPSISLSFHSIIYQAPKAQLGICSQKWKDHDRKKLQEDQSHKGPVNNPAATMLLWRSASSQEMTIL